MKFDLIVLGGGPAGYHASEQASRAGLNVCCIEERSVGGVCLNEGCIPTKTLLYSAKIFDAALHGEKYGVNTEGITIDHEKVLARKNKVVKILNKGIESSLKSAGVTLVMGRGQITGSDLEGYHIEVDQTTYTGSRLLIATGSSTVIPNIQGLSEGIASGFVCTTREILNLKEKPKHLVVIGGGVIGLELANYFSSIRTKVTVIEILDHIAGENDPELTELLKTNLEKNDVTFQLLSKVTEIKNGCVQYEQNGEINEIDCDRVLLSTGRRANTGGIGLEKIGILTEREFILTDKQMKTNQANVFAAGDVNGKSMLAHTAYREAEVAVHAMLGKPDAMDYESIPGVIYTNPELASVGETEVSAVRKGIRVSTIKLPMRFSGRYLAENDGGNGVMKLIIQYDTKKVIGAQILGNYSSEFIVMLGTFIQLQLPAEEIMKIVFPHPTVGEVIHEAVYRSMEA